MDFLIRILLSLCFGLRKRCGQLILFYLYCKQEWKQEQIFPHWIPLEWIQAKFITSDCTFGKGVKCAQQAVDRLHLQRAQPSEWAVLALVEVEISAHVC